MNNLGDFSGSSPPATDAVSADSDVAAPFRPRHLPLWRWFVPLSLLVGLVALGAAVDRGTLHSVDRWGYEHRASDPAALQPLTDPAELTVSALILFAALVGLRKRKRVATVWLAVYAVSLGTEIVGKALVTTPFAAPNTLVGTSITQGSFPSGHSMRVIVLAGALATAWPRSRWLAALWASATVALIEVSGMHSPSEVFGGVLGGLALIGAAWAAGGMMSEPSGRRD